MRYWVDAPYHDMEIFPCDTFFEACRIARAHRTLNPCFVIGITVGTTFYLNSTRFFMPNPYHWEDLIKIFYDGNFVTQVSSFDELGRWCNERLDLDDANRFILNRVSLERHVHLPRVTTLSFVKREHWQDLTINIENNFSYYVPERKLDTLEHNWEQEGF